MFCVYGSPTKTCDNFLFDMHIQCARNSKKIVKYVRCSFQPSSTSLWFIFCAIIIRFVVVLVYKNCIRAGLHIAQFAQSFFRIIPIHNTVIDFVQCFGFSRSYFIYSIIN